MQHATITKPATRAGLLRQLKSQGYSMSGLLADPVSNPKVAKNGKIGVMTAPLHLAPYDVSGYQVCPMATQGCAKACLHTAGNPAYMAQKQKSRVVKTKAYFEARDLFMQLLALEIDALRRRAHKAGMEPGVRLNATSDIPWERVPFVLNGNRYASLMDYAPDVQFYDYTKRHNRKNLPANYHLTYSLAEDNDVQALAALRNGMNVAAVFDTKRNKPLPPFMTWTNLNGPSRFRAAHRDFLFDTWPVIDGDEHDFRPADGKGVIVGLRAKGDAIGDTSGFVRPSNYA